MQVAKWLPTSPLSSLFPFERRSPRVPMWLHTGSLLPHRPSEQKLKKSNVQKLIASYAKVYPSIPTGSGSTQVEKEVCARGTTCLGFACAVFLSMGTGGPPVGYGTRQTASSARTRSAPAAGPRGMDQLSTTLPAARRGRDASVAIFGRLMRR